MKHTLLFIFIPIYLSLFSVSCHKSKSSSATPVCKLTSVSQINGGLSVNYDLSYDDKGRLAEVDVSGNGAKPCTRTFTYGDHLILVTNTFSGTIVSTTIDSVFLDAGGKISQIYAGGDGNNSYLVYTRDNQGQLQQSSTIFNGTTTTTTTYQYTDGDLTSGSTGGAPFSYTYYTDKPSTNTDALSIAFWMEYGAVIYNNRHLVKGFQTSANTETFTYNTDSKGNITDATITFTNSQSTTYHYTYDCN